MGNESIGFLKFLYENKMNSMKLFFHWQIFTLDETASSQSYYSYFSDSVHHDKNTGEYCYPDFEDLD